MQQAIKCQPPQSRLPTELAAGRRASVHPSLESLYQVGQLGQRQVPGDAVVDVQSVGRPAGMGS